MFPIKDLPECVAHALINQMAKEGYRFVQLGSSQLPPFAPNPCSLIGFTMQCIRTRYLGPTSTRNARIFASAESETLTVSYDHNLNCEGNHIAAAQSLLKRLNAGKLWQHEISGTGCFQEDYYHTVAFAPTAPK